MVFSDKTYSILVVSSNEKFNNVVSGILPMNEYWPVIFIKNAEEARRLFFDKGFDIVVINTPLPDSFGDALACDICDKSESGVLLLAGSDYFDNIYYKTVEHGVLTVQKPVTSTALRHSLNLVAATVERIRRIMTKQGSVNDKIEEMRLVNKAKWMLIDHAHMTEPEAHRFIEKKAMDERTTKKEIAKKVISHYE